ncbi:MAG: hypothetical protein ABIG69_03755 [Bacteroidota bacterium]
MIKSKNLIELDCQQLRKDIKEFNSDIKNISDNVIRIKKKSSKDIKCLKEQLTITKKSLRKKCK